MFYLKSDSKLFPQVVVSTNSDALRLRSPAGPTARSPPSLLSNSSACQLLSKAPALTGLMAQFCFSDLPRAKLRRKASFLSPIFCLLSGRVLPAARMLLRGLRSWKRSYLAPPVSLVSLLLLLQSQPVSPSSQSLTECIQGPERLLEEHGRSKG